MIAVPDFHTTYANVKKWGQDRGITLNGKPMGQAIKTLEETTELVDAIHKGSVTECMDAIGDIMVTLVMNCELMGLDMEACFAVAYNEIKDRKGYLNEAGIFIKEPA